jgi:hypothetical protein
MIKSSKAGVVLASAVGVAFLALTGCASQQSGAATPANLPGNCKVISSCKGMSSCKAMNSCKNHKHQEEKAQ